MANLRNRAKEATVRQNCHTVRLAAEDFSVTNLGPYPQDLSDALPNGTTLVDLLPNAALLENPFTGANSEPINGAAAAAGEIGYAPVIDAGGIAVGYTINGFGYEYQIALMTAGI
jgi:hypothetical protein